MEPDREEFYRSLVVGFCDVFTNGSLGRLREDPVAREVTGGHGGSSCGFLLHKCCEMIGICEPWVNSDSVNHYRSGQNLSLLFQATWGAPKGPRAAKKCTRGLLFKHGDFLIMGSPQVEDNDDHVCVVAKDFNGERT